MASLGQWKKCNSSTSLKLWQRGGKGGRLSSSLTRSFILIIGWTAWPTTLRGYRSVSNSFWSSTHVSPHISRPACQNLSSTSTLPLPIAQPRPSPPSHASLQSAITLLSPRESCKVSETIPALCIQRAASIGGLREHKGEKLQMCNILVLIIFVVWNL